jgi:hypothetical protein
MSVKCQKATFECAVTSAIPDLQLKPIKNRHGVSIAEAEISMFIIAQKET